MARSRVEKVYRNFAAGLITEASSLSFPENALHDALNMELTKEGHVVRRRGLEFEAGYQLSPIGFPTLPKSTLIYLWENADGSGNDYAVVGIDHTLLYFNASTSQPSQNFIGYTTLPFPAAGSSITGISKYLVIARDGGLPVYVGSDDLLTTTPITLLERDFGDASPFRDNESPTAATAEYLYDMWNRGWYHRNMYGRNASGGLISKWPVLPRYYTDVGRWPSKAIPFRVGFSGSPRPSWSSFMYKDGPEAYYTGSSPKGHFLLSAHTHDRAGIDMEDGFTVLGRAKGLLESYRVFYNSPTDESISGEDGLYPHSPVYPTCVATYSGRVWYGGFGSPSQNSVYYSQLILRDPTRLGKCYQENDPTNPEANEVLDTDGGHIAVEGMGKLVAMVPLGNSLVLLATNGVWGISGGDSPFSPTNVMVSKISSVGALSEDSVISVGNQVLYMSRAGIEVVAADQALGTLSSANITEQTIQSYYVEIPGPAKRAAKAVYDEYNKRVMWLYRREDEYTESTETGLYNSALVLDLRLGAFVPMSYTMGPYICGAVLGPASATTTYEEQVTVDGEVVTVDGEDVTISSTYQSQGFSGLKFVTIVPDEGQYRVTFSETSNRNMVDWATYNDGQGADYVAYAEAGEDNLGDASRSKDVPKLHLWFKITEDGVAMDGDGNLDFAHKSSCHLTAKWEWTDTDTANRWHKVGEVYRLPATYTPSGVETGDDFDYSYTVATNSTSIYGSGRSLRLRFTAQPGKDMQILGYSITYTVEGQS